ncbi:sigma-70 family RNA polymerase sigma factor [Pantoea sp. 18069]|uniref:sigma-70 family RNA polymerase sigma factor n=1 Tax=Pantoea sp. 18069 TaxID=2681415 RepID=UPI001F33FEC0|nr:sigma-70 family RNA polymerase sigma factor [Pantoea sp. 18069]
MSTLPPQPSSVPAVEALYVEHHGWLQMWLRKKLSNAADAADIAHDTFVRVLASRSRTRIAEPRAFLTTVARGLVIDTWRRQEIERAYREALLRQPEQFAPSPEAHLVIVETLARIDQLLDGLKPKVRTAFLLAQIEEMHHGAIAERMGVSARSVDRYVAEGLYHCHIALSAA